MIKSYRSGLLIKLREERGVAMLVVLFAVVVVTVMGAALVTSGVRDLDSSISVQRASTALGIAEAGVQHATQQLQKYGPIGADIVRCRRDHSAGLIDQSTGQTRTGWGQFMNPSDRTLSPFFNPNDPKVNSTDPNNPPTNCGPYVGNVGNGRYTVSAVGVSTSELIDLPTSRVGTYRIDALGFDRRDRPGRPGERTVQQNVRIETLDVPFSLFAKSGIDASGSPKVMSESIYTEGNLYFRDKITFQAAGSDPNCPYAQGCDLFYGWDGTKCGASPAPPNSPCPVSANAAGTIFKGNGGNNPQNGPIHTPPFPPGYANCGYPYDRDTDGGAYPIYAPPLWSCSTAAVPPLAPPPYDSSDFTINDLPPGAGGPSGDVYQLLKQIAISSNTYCNHTSSANIQIGASAAGRGGDCEHINDYATKIPPEKFFVMYIDSTASAGSIAIKDGWGPQTTPPQTQTPCTGHFGIVVVRNGGVRWENNKVWWGAAFVPEGRFHGSGFGEAWFVGTIYAKEMTLTGNLKFQLNNCWVDSVASPAFFLVTRLRWHESDR